MLRNDSFVKKIMELRLILSLNIFYALDGKIFLAFLRHLDLTAHKLSAKLFLWLNANFRWF